MKLISPEENLLNPVVIHQWQLNRHLSEIANRRLGPKVKRIIRPHVLAESDSYCDLTFERNENGQYSLITPVKLVSR